MTSRRSFATAALLLLAAPRVLAADPKPARLARVAFVHPVPTDDELRSFRHPFAKIFVEGMRELGWRDGENVQIVWRGGGDDWERVPLLLEKLARMPVDAIVIARGGQELAKPVAERHPSLPIVCEFVNLAGSQGKAIPRPAPNVTGVSIESHEYLSAKRIALLKEALGVKRVVFIRIGEKAEPLKAVPGNFHPALQASADALGVRIENLVVEPTQLEAAAKLLARDRTVAVVAPFTFGVPHIWGRKDAHEIQEVLIRNRVPVLGVNPEAVDDGMLMGYGPEKLFDVKRFPYFVDRILRGTDVRNLPIELPGKYKLAVNLDTARALGITLPPTLMLQADVVVGASN